MSGRRLAAYLISLAILAFAAAWFFASRSEPDSPDWARKADLAFQAGDWETARSLYEAASERSSDPGRIAFNLGAIAFAEGNTREAELYYLQALEDQECPPFRKLQALYNRGVCLLTRHSEIKSLRVGIQCLEICLRSPDLEESLRLDVRHNLELAKLLWLQARRREAESHRAQEPDQSLPPPVQELMIETVVAEIARAAPGENPSANLPRPGGQEPVDPTPSDRMAPGQGTLPVLRNDGTPQPLSPEDTQMLLRSLELRLNQDRRSGNQIKAGPDRPRVRDW